MAMGDTVGEDTDPPAGFRSPRDAPRGIPFAGDVNEESPREVKVGQVTCRAGEEIPLGFGQGRIRGRAPWLLH